MAALVVRDRVGRVVAAALEAFAPRTTGAAWRVTRDVRAAAILVGGVRSGVRRQRRRMVVVGCRDGINQSEISYPVTGSHLIGRGK